MPSVAACGSIFGPVQLHIAEDDCPPNVVDVRMRSSAAACSSDESSRVSCVWRVLSLNEVLTPQLLVMEST